MLHLISNQRGPSGLRRCNVPVVNWRGVGSNPAGDIYFHFEIFSLPPRSEQVNGAVANEIKHLHSPEVIVVLDPRYDLSYKALYISTCSIALTCPSYTDTGPPFLYGDSDTPPNLVAFYDTLGIRRTYSRLKPSASSRGLNTKEKYRGMLEIQKSGKRQVQEKLVST